jgi:NAD(P)-dependent dehydrogenase (short-subunit alcohol dehydrogenase family)
MMQLPRTPSFRLDGRTALVFGASSGIGLGAAVALAEAGAHVICAARGAERLHQAVDQMQAAGLKAEAAVLDAADIAATRAFIAAMPRLDVMVNSAGVARHTPALETSEGDFDLVATTNLKAAYFAASAAGAKMIERVKAGHQKGGSIITVSSQMGHVGGVDRAVYAATKHGVEGMIKSMAIEWGAYNIRVNTLCPTFVATPLTEETLSRPERLEWILSKIKLGRVADVEDMMGPLLLLASDAGAMITGTALMVDGGWTAD